MIGYDYSYYNYNGRFKKVMVALDIEHTPHECRTTFATRIARTDADKLTARRILGHSDKHITDKVYTKKDITDLLKAIDCLEE